MKGKFFIDTNIIIYSFDNNNTLKMEKARKIISEALSSSNGIISFQVIQEFINIATGKFKKKLSLSDTREYLTEVLLPICEIFPGNEFYMNALEIKERTGYSFYDSMIIQAALESRCNILYSEDLQDGFKLFELMIRNPFKEI